MKNPALEKLEQQKQKIEEMAEKIKQYQYVDPELNQEIEQMYNEVIARINLIDCIDYSFYR